MSTRRVLTIMKSVNATSVAVAAILVLALLPLRLTAQLVKPQLTIEEDCQTFAVAQDNKIVFAVAHQKRLKKVILERDDIWVSSADGRKKRILEGDKFMPTTQMTSFTVTSLAWSPNGQRITVAMEMQMMSDNPEAAAKGSRSVLLLDEEGREISIAGNTPKAAPAPAAPAKPAGFSSSDDAPAAAAGPQIRPSMIDSVTSGEWLADGATVAYLTGAGPYQINTVRPADGQKRLLFEGHTFQAVVWDSRRNQAFAITQGLRGPLVLMQLDLVHETLRELAAPPGYDGQLSVSPSGKRVAYFYNGDVLEVRDVAHPENPMDVRVGYGRFEWSKDERRILLKRGPEKRSGNLVWISFPEGNFKPFLHDLIFHDFTIAPDGETVVVTQPGKRVLMVYKVN